MWPAIIGCAVVLAAGGLGRWGYRSRRQYLLRRAARSFRLQREYLEAKFFEMARTGPGVPRGLIWVDCEWHNGVTFAIDRDNKRLTAFTGIRVKFGPRPGSDTEEELHLAFARDATAVFHFERGRWTTAGKTLFNVDPAEALLRFRYLFEPLAMSPPSR